MTIKQKVVRSFAVTSRLCIRSNAPHIAGHKIAATNVSTIERVDRSGSAVRHAGDNAIAASFLRVG